jgi:hypothetical protein
MLRTAWDAMMKDPHFLADVKKQGLDFDPMPGSEVQRLVEDRVRDTSPAVIQRAKMLFQH